RGHHQHQAQAEQSAAEDRQDHTGCRGRLPQAERVRPRQPQEDAGDYDRHHEGQQQDGPEMLPRSHRQPSAVYFISSNNMTTGIFAWMLRRKPFGMWTQVPGLSSTVSSLSVSFASPWRKCKTTAIEEACSESSSPWAKPKATALSRSSFNRVRLKMPLSGGWSPFARLRNKV